MEKTYNEQTEEPPKKKKFFELKNTAAGFSRPQNNQSRNNNDKQVQYSPANKSYGTFLVDLLNINCISCFENKF